MKDLSDIKVCFVDHGLFLPMARKFAQSCNLVWYHTPYEEGFSKVENACIGEGFDDVVRCDDIWKVYNDVDLFVFPDIEHAGLQMHLRKEKPVWGAAYGDQLELDRLFFLDVLKEYGLEIPRHEVAHGIEELRIKLKDKKDCYIKISKFRGSMETTHWRSWDEDWHLLDYLGTKLGPPALDIPFIVFEAINTPLEIGADTYCIDGKWPSLMLHGLEAKDKSYLGSVTRTKDMPDFIRDMLGDFGAELRAYDYRSQWSMEVRVKDDKAYFIDPTCRGGLPSTGSAIEIWDNLPEIMWAGAHGELVEPEPIAQFSAEVIVEVGDPEDWRSITDNHDLGDALKLSNCYRRGNTISFPPHRGCGWLVATGDSPTEAVTTLMEMAKLLPDGCKVDVTPLSDVIKEVEEAKKEGIEFTGKPMPEPSIVVEDA